MSELQKPPIYANKTVLTIGTVGGIILLIVGPIMWAAKKEAELSTATAAITELRTRVSAVESRSADTDVWRGKLDVTLSNIAQQIADIKKAVER